MKVDVLDSLLADGMIDEQIYYLVIGYCKRWNVKEFEGLVATRLFEEEVLVRLLSEHYELPIAEDLTLQDVSSIAACTVTYEQARRYTCFPLEEGSGDIKQLWIANPSEEGLEQVCPDIPRVLGTRCAILQAICEHYPFGQQCPDLGGHHAS